MKLPSLLLRLFFTCVPVNLTNTAMSFLPTTCLMFMYSQVCLYQKLAYLNLYNCSRWIGFYALHGVLEVCLTKAGFKHWLLLWYECKMFPYLMYLDTWSPACSAVLASHEAFWIWGLPGRLRPLETGLEGSQPSPMSTPFLCILIHQL